MDLVTALPGSLIRTASSHTEPVWLSIIKLFFNERIGAAVFHLTEISVNIGMVLTLTRGKHKYSILLFATSLMMRLS